MPFWFVLPSAASPNMVSINDSNCSAGRTSARKRSVSSPRVPELVRQAGIDQRHLARAELELLASALHAEPTFEDREDLRLVGVNVRGRDGSARLDEGVEERVLAVRVVRRELEDEPFAGHGVDDRVSCANHCGCLPVEWCREGVSASAPGITSARRPITDRAEE